MHRLPRLGCCLTILLSFFAAAVARAGAGDDDGGVAWTAYENAVHLKLHDGDYAGLEKMAQQLRDSKARFTDGRFKLDAFYNGVGFWGKTAKNWPDYLQKLDAWKQAFPISITQPVVRARAYLRIAGIDRGAGPDDKLAPGALDLYHDDLAKARAALDESKKLFAICPEWYMAMMEVVAAQGGDERTRRAAFEQVFQEAINQEPTYYYYYFLKAKWLLILKHGDAAEWSKFADHAAHNDDPQEGISLYSRIAWSLSGYYPDLFKDQLIDWAKMRQGFEDMEKAYPNSNWNLNAFCHFAYLAQDRETTRALLQRIGDKPDPLMWGKDLAKFQAVKQWAAGN